MDYIILDIEFNGRKFASDLPMEVIEIGAVRMDASLQVKDHFTAFVKPVYFAQLNSFIKKKTGIPQESIDTAEGFPKVSADFTRWLQKSSELMFVTWGGEDFKRIIYDTRMHKLDDSFWMNVQYFDLLKGYLRYKNVTNDVSVEGAVAELGIPSTGSAHRALDDALMTAEIFRAIYASLDFERAQHFKDTYSNAKERRMVKNAVRAMKVQKAPMEWGVLLERYLKDKLPPDDAKKLAELQEYFLAEVDKLRTAQAQSQAGQQAALARRQAAETQAGQQADTEQEQEAPAGSGNK